MTGDGGDDAVHFVVKVVHLVAVLQESETKNESSESIQHVFDLPHSADGDDNDDDEDCDHNNSNDHNNERQDSTVRRVSP